jgi:hypothetical protein
VPSVIANPGWLRSRRFDLWLQAGALICIAPALLAHAALGATRASAYLSLGILVAIPFLHVFGSFFVAFGKERNESPTRPRTLALTLAAWAIAAIALSRVAPRALATFALIYGGWHILRQNFGFLRELSARTGHASDRALRRLDLAACFAPALALWLLIDARGPWLFIAAEVYHPSLPKFLLPIALALVAATAIVRITHRSSTGRGAALILAGNGFALLAPALLLDDLTLIYTLSASFHGFQYLAYVAEKERERTPQLSIEQALLPLFSSVLGMMLAWFVALLVVGWLLSPERATDLLSAVWYAIVPFHYFVDGRIWKRPRHSRGVT